jgi:tetratricopeptide (TPR) repeat protein
LVLLVVLVAAGTTGIVVSTLYGFPQMIVILVFLVLFFEGASRTVLLVRTPLVVRATARRARAAWRPREYLVPRALPPVPELLIGRATELSTLRSYLSGLPPNHSPATVVIHGEAGVGRTTLALRLAHEIAEDYPDGQIYADLECTDVDLLDQNKKCALSDGLAVLVKALDTPWGRLPASFDERAAIYKELSADKRLLVVLDNARDEKELASLLPTGAGSVAIIISGGPLAHLDEVKELPLGPLREPDAVTLLERIVGDGQIERHLMEKLVRACDHHPLAIRLVGIALTAYSGTDLNREVAQLITAQRTMVVPVTSSLGGILDGAYSTLTADEQTALRCLGTMNKVVFAPWMFVAASGIAPHNCSVLADRLIRAQLLTKISGTSRRSPLYRLSPAVLEYARGRAAREDNAVVHDRMDRLKRAFQWRHERSSQLVKALESAESGNLADAIAMAREEMFLARDRDDHVIEARANAMLADLHTELGYLVEARESIDLALGSDDPLSKATAHRVRGKIAYRQRRLADAEAEFDAALAFAGEAKETVEMARIHGERAIGLARAARFEAAFADADKAMEICHALEPLSRFRALCAKATVHFYLYEPELAEQLLAKARPLLGDGDEHILSRAWLLHAHARIAQASGDTDGAIAFATEGLGLFVRMRHRYGVAHCRSELGRAFVVLAQDDAAIDAFREALTIFRNCGGDWVEGRISFELAMCHRRRGQHDRADQLDARAAEVFATLGDGDLAVQAAGGLAFSSLRRHLRQQIKSVSY